MKQNEGKPLEASTIQELIRTFVPLKKSGLIKPLTCLASFVHQYDEELNEMKKARRKGRPASAKEDLLKVKIENLEKEWQNGFCKY